MTESGRRSHLLASLFFFSGITGLVYEVVWARVLSTILGSTLLAVSVTVSIFLTGLAVGSLIGARRSLRKWSVLGVYSLLEALIAGYAVTTPWLAVWVEKVYAGRYASFSGHFFASVMLKAFVAAPLLLLPAILMGATLPILVQWFDPAERREKAGWLYGINTAGAVAGAVLSGYWLIPAFGLSRTIYMMACLNGAVAVMAFLSRKREAKEEFVVPRVSSFRPLFLLFLMTGFASLCYEILWTRSLSMFFGSSVYAFASVLAAFLFGIACGSAYYSKRIPAGTDPFQLFSLIQFRLALAGVFFVGILMSLPPILILLYSKLYFSFSLFQLGQFAVIFLLIGYATFLSGAAYPAALHFFRQDSARMHQYSGYIYAYNTLGGILGSLCAGFLLIPTLGVERSIRIVALIHLLLGMLCFRRSPPQSQSRRVLLIGGLSLALLMILPGWNKSIYNSGIYANAYRYVSTSAQTRNRGAGVPPAPGNSPKDLAGLLPEARPSLPLNLLYYGEGLTATVAVSENNLGIRSLLINGKSDASTMPTGDMRTQLLLGHLPVLLLRRNVSDALVVGLGSGVTAGALAMHSLPRIDCVEIENKVVEAARFFETENNGILNRPNFHLLYDDGRNVIQHTSASYDVITSEPSNLWMSGVANLFTREFFQAAGGRLRQGGIFCQWIHLYQISARDILIFLKTFHSVFPHLSVWIVDTDMLVLGSDRPIQIDPGLIQQRLLLPEIARSVEPSGITVGSLLRCYLGDERTATMMDPSIPWNTDDRPILEFSAPRSLFFDRSSSIVRMLKALNLAAERTP